MQFSSLQYPKFCVWIRDFPEENRLRNALYCSWGSYSIQLICLQQESTAVQYTGSQNLKQS